MVPGDVSRRGPARERWFWIGVGFVSALAMLVLGLVFAVSLTARDTAPAVARQPSPPAPTVATAPLELPPPPVDAMGLPQRRALPPPPPPVIRNTPAAPPAPRLPAPSRVRVVERPGGPVPGAPASPPATGTLSIKVEKRKAGTSPSSPKAAAPGVREQVGGSWEERVAPSPPRRPGNARPPRTVRRSAPSVETSGATPPRLISGRDADYPLDAMHDGVTGTVVLKVVVSPEGFVERAVVTRSSGDGRLDAAAVRAVMAWRYQPARRGGVPVPGTDTATIEFFRER